MVKQDHNVPSAFFEHDVDNHHHDPFGLHAFYNTPIGPNFHSRRGVDDHQLQHQHQQQALLLHHHHQQRPYIHQEPQDDIFALKGEPLPANLQAPPVFRPDFSLSATIRKQGLLQQQQQQQQQNKDEVASINRAEDKDASTSATVATSALLLPPSAEQKLPSVKAENSQSTSNKDDAQSETAPSSAASAPKPAASKAKASSVPKKRTRPVSACEGCRAKKVKCNLKPDLPICENCSAAGKTCLFRIDDLSPAFRAQRFGVYNLLSAGENDGAAQKSNTVGGGSVASADGSRIVDDVPGETTSQRRMRRKRAREAILATGQRPPKAKAVFKSWANPSKLAAPCMPLKFHSATPTQNSPDHSASSMMMMHNNLGVPSSVGAPAPSFSASMSMPQPFFDNADAFSHQFAFGAPNMINASGVFHAASSLPAVTPPATALSMVGSWDSTSAQFSSSFGSMSQHHMGGSGSMPHGMMPFHAAGAMSIDGSSMVGGNNNGTGMVGSPQGSIGSSFASTSYLDSAQSMSSSIDNPHTPGLTDGSGEMLVMSPFSAAGGAGLSPTMTTSSAVRSNAAGAGGNRPEMHLRRHTTGPVSMTALSLPGAFGTDNMVGHSMVGLDHPMSNGGLASHQQFTFPMGGAEKQGSGEQQHALHASMFHFQQQHHRSSTGSAFMGMLPSSMAGGDSMTSGSIPTPTPFEHGMHQHAGSVPPHRRPQTSSASAFISDWDALTGFPPRETMAEPSVPVDLGMGLGGDGVGGGADEFLGGFEMTLA
ncbi:hypothetical protein CF319_g1613 [Tilletia indica]|nr:hypothetical protein CF319_g1613 [Tilletia indica]